MVLVDIPTPPVETWVEFPVVAIIVLVVAFLGGSAGVVVRWVWGEAKKIIAEDRAWREVQNEKREQAAAIQNASWQAAINKLASRWEEQDKQRESTLSAIAAATNQMLERLEVHDQHARNVSEAVNRLAPKVEAVLERRTTPRRKTP